MANTVVANWLQWSGWDWSKNGEEWSNTPEWKASLITHVLEPSVPIGSRTLEIGPGAGRWTEALVDRASQLWLVDLTGNRLTFAEESLANAATFIALSTMAVT